MLSGPAPLFEPTATASACHQTWSSGNDHRMTQRLACTVLLKFSIALLPLHGSPDIGQRLRPGLVLAAERGARVGQAEVSCS
jgi:hypothetical protein